MISKKAIARALSHCEKLLKGIEAKKWTLRGVLPTGLDTLKHAKWACEEALFLVDRGKYRRATYHLGLIHATLWRYGKADLTKLGEEL